MRGERWSKVKGWRSDNPVRNLDREEKPTLESRQTHILEEDEIRTLLDTAPPKYAPVIRTAVFTGLGWASSWPSGGQTSTLPPE